MGYHLNARYGAAGNAPGRLWRGLVAVILSFALFLQGAIPAQAALFGSFGVKDEKELGRKFDVLVRSRMPLVEDPEIKGYIQSIVDRLSKTFPPQPFPFTANVLLHNSMNAFAVPGGSVFVHTGLIMQLDHESELAGVLGHELAHVTQRHIATRMERAQAVTIGSLVGALAAALLGGGQGRGAIFAGSVAAGQAAMLNYSRMDETEADQIGLQYLTSAGYRPQGLQGAFEKIRRKQWASGIDIPEYLSTHPDVGGRINEIHARIQGLPAAVRNRKDDDTRFNRVKTLIWARYGDPDAAARFFAKQLEGKKPDCPPTWGKASSPSAAIRSRKLTRPSPRRWPVRPATLSSYARQGGSITIKAMPGPEEHCSGRWSWTPTTSWPSSSTPGCWTAAATRLPPTSTTSRSSAGSRRTRKCITTMDVRSARPGKYSTPTCISPTALCIRTTNARPKAGSSRPARLPERP